MNAIEHTDLSKPIYDKVKQMILSNELKPGEKIVQEKIAKQLGVSRTPLHKALQQLEFDYFVESIPRRGMYVRKTDIKELIDVFDTREGLETIAVRLAIENNPHELAYELRTLFKPFESSINSINMEAYAYADDQFHKLLVKYSGNDILNRLYIFGNINSMVVQTGLLRSPAETYKEHIDIIEAIEKQNTELAEVLVKNHIRLSRNILAMQLVNED